MSDRRSFLRGLASLPMIGGGVALIGQPTAAAVPVTDKLLDSYATWLHYERNWLQWERYGAEGYKDRPIPDVEVVWHDRRNDKLFDFIPMTNPAAGHDYTGAASRAAVILSAAGVPLSKRRHL